MLTCQVCQKENPAGAEYCEDCGAALNAEPVTVGAGASSARTGSAGGASSVPTPSPAANPSGPSGTANPAGSIGALSPSEPGPASPAAPESTADRSEAAADLTPTTPSAPAGAGPAAPGGPASGGAAPASASAAPAGQARLLAVRYGAPTGDEIPLIGQRLVVGRFDPETGPVDIDLSETAESGHISRQHGELYRDADGAWTARDLGSTNGVFVKSADAASFGPRITAPRTLNDGDEVAFGNARFIFRTS